jgi:hypothetical protein
MKSVRWVGAILTLLLNVASARAVFIQSSVGLPSAQTITFAEHGFPAGTPVTTQYADLGVTFSPNLYYSPLATAGIPHIDDTNLGNFAGFGNPAVNPFIIHFNQPQTAADFAMATVDPGASTFTALLGGVPVETATAFTSLDTRQNFYGFTGITFDAIEVTAAGSSGVMGLDNLQTAPAAAAPAPPGLVLVGLGVLGLAVYGRPRRRATAGPNSPAEGQRDEAGAKNEK